MNKNKIGFCTNALVTSLILMAPVHLTAGSYPMCTNNTITLPGESGPEIWSCVPNLVNTSNYTASASQDIQTSEVQTSTDASGAGVLIEKRTQASSQAMKDEIERVLESAPDTGKAKRRKSLSVGLQYSTNRKASSLSESRGRSVAVPLSVGFDLTDRTRMSVSVPLISKESELVGNSDVYNSDAFGVGDVSISATSQVFNETDSRPGVSVSVGLGAPTGKKKIHNCLTSYRLARDFGAFLPVLP